MLGKRKPSSSLPPKKRRKPIPSIEEIQFDASAREDYLTGFHKRKLQRIKHAKEEAAKKEREERIAARKLLREGRKADLEKHVEAVNTLVRDAAIAAGEIDEDGEADGEEGADLQDGVAKAAIVVDHEEEFIDEDRYTTVTIEAVDISKDGLHKVLQEAGGAGDGSNLPAPCRVATGVKRVWTKERPGGPKKKKKKFKYESRAERKVTRYKERSGNKSKAKARKE